LDRKETEWKEAEGNCLTRSFTDIFFAKCNQNGNVKEDVMSRVYSMNGEKTAYRIFREKARRKEATRKT
jgi:hypothetical protein